ncbi:MAG: hypothetical protein U1F77_04195 [Kiritimatiellia bacterium]
MKLQRACTLGALLMLAGAASAEVTIKTEQLNPAGPAWKFTTVPGPSRSDVAQGARVTLEGNSWEPQGAGPEALVNGRLPGDSLDLTEGVLLSNANADGGVVTLDLGRVQAVAAVATYSWHEWNVDDGSRGPQVYALSGSADGAAWTNLAAVDTRPNQTGEKWNGQHGVVIQDSTGKLGDFRFLRFEVKATRSPRQGTPGLTNTLFSEIDVHTAETLARAGDATVVQPVKITDVWVTFKTHCDIGYTDTIEGVLRKFRVNMMDIALKNIEADRGLPAEKRFAWMLAGWPLKHVLGPQQDPERRVRIEQAVREGALGIGAIPFSLQTETLDLEDLVRGLGYASQIARRYGRPLPIAAKMTDVPCHSWAWPTVLKHSGVRFLQLGCNGNSGHLAVPPLFWWEGPDGSRVLCNFTPEYGSGIFPPRNWPARNYLAMIMTGDNHGPPTQAEVEQLRRQAEKVLPGVRVHLGTLDDFARALIEEDRSCPWCAETCRTHGSTDSARCRWKRRSPMPSGRSSRRWKSSTRNSACGGWTSPPWPRRWRTPTNKATCTASIPSDPPPRTWGPGTAGRPGTSTGRNGGRPAKTGSTRCMSTRSRRSGTSPASRSRSSTGSSVPGWNNSHRPSEAPVPGPSCTTVCPGPAAGRSRSRAA